MCHHLDSHVVGGRDDVEAVALFALEALEGVEVGAEQALVAALRQQHDLSVAQADVDVLAADVQGVERCFHSLVGCRRHLLDEDEHLDELGGVAGLDAEPIADALAEACCRADTSPGGEDAQRDVSCVELGIRGGRHGVAFL